MSSNIESNIESVVKDAIEEIVKGNSYEKTNVPFKDSVFGVACTMHGIDILLRNKDKGITKDMIQKQGHNAIKNIIHKYTQTTFVTKQIENKLLELLYDLINNLKLETIVEITSLIFGDAVSNLEILDAILDQRIFDFETNTNVLNDMISLVEKEKSIDKLDWFIESMKWRKRYINRNKDVLDKLVGAAKSTLIEQSA